MTNSNDSTGKKEQADLLCRIRQLPIKRILIGASAVIALLLLLFLICIRYLIATAPDIDSITVSPTESATYICDQNGNYLRKLTLASSNRDIVKLDDIPDSLQKSVIAIEDQRFYEHGGIDVRGIARAFWTGITSGSFSEGASTITQQLIKNNVFTEWTLEDSFTDRFSRKIQEQYLALKLEDRMSKEEILEDYLNTINLGSGCYGVQSASRRYFGKNVEDLTLSESAILAAIPQNPTANNPITNPEANRKRRQTVLEYMKEQGYISEGEYKTALEDDVYARIRTFDENYREETAYSYYEDALIDQVLDLLEEKKGYSQEQAYRAVYSGGLRIYSAQDSALQKICDEEFQDPANFPEGTLFGVDYALSVSDENGLVTHYGSESLRSYIRRTIDSSFDLMCSSEEEARKYADSFREHILNENTKEKLTALGERLTLSPQPQASLVLIEQETGCVRAIVGGRGEKTASLTLNRATDTTRQPGSTFKILTAYAPALDAYGQTLATTYENEPYRYENGTPVSNWDITDYSGTVTVREAITRSINVVAVKCITEISPLTGFQYAKNFGISTLCESCETGNGVSSDIIQPLALGGITRGVTNLELCSAYGTIASQGICHPPRFFTKVLDRHGNVLLDYEEENPARQVLREATAFLLTDAMKDVVSDPSGTAYTMISAAGQPVAGKTGTTSDYKDIWFAGYTPYYTCCVWGGYDNNRSLPEGSLYHSYSKVLWSAVMDRIHESLPGKDFPIPDTIRAVTLCRTSHLPAVADGCPDTYEEYFAADTCPQKECPLHEPVPETEPENIFIYPDILGEIVPETESESETGTESESDPETESGSESESDSEFSSESGSGSDLEFPDTEAGPETLAPEFSSGEASWDTPRRENGQPDTSSLEDLMNRLTGQNTLF